MVSALRFIGVIFGEEDLVRNLDGSVFVSFETRCLKSCVLRVVRFKYIWSNGGCHWNQYCESFRGVINVLKLLWCDAFRKYQELFFGCLDLKHIPLYTPEFTILLLIGFWKEYCHLLTVMVLSTMRWFCTVWWCCRNFIQWLLNAYPSLPLIYCLFH
jgi:hypothetical protein